MILTTTNSIEGIKIIKYFDPVSKSVVLGSNIIADIGAGFTDLFGGRSRNYESRLQSINGEVLGMLKKHAVKLKADAIVGIKIDVDEIAGGGKNMFMVTAIGTPVILDKSDGADNEVVSSHELVNMKVQAKRIMQSTKNDLFRLKPDDVSFVVQSGLEEFIPYVRAGLEKHQILDDYDASAIKSTLRDILMIFENIPIDKSKETLYSLLEDGIHNDIKEIMLDIIIELGLVDYKNAVNLLESEDIGVQKCGLKILNQDKATYSHSDIETMKNLYGDRIISFFSEASLYEEKGLMGTKRKWKCICRTANSDKEYNCICGKDRMGFSVDDVTPKEVQELINDRMDVLKKM